MLWSLARHVIFAEKALHLQGKTGGLQDRPCLGEQICLILALTLGGHSWHKPKSTSSN